MDEKTLAELIASTARANHDNAGWFTAAEFAAAAGKSRYWACQRLTRAVSDGEVVCERRMATNVLGDPQSKPMYRRVRAKVKVGK